jgi:membrane protein implicated in regulation of membrane protease activity
MYSEFGKFFVIFGIIFIVIGLIMIFGEKFISSFHLFRLPGDIFIKKGNFTFYFPIITSIIISIILTAFLNIFFRK